MKTLIVSMGFLAATVFSAFAAEPAKMVDTKMGKILANAKGMTLYTFDKDAMGKSNCDEACLKKWPAFHADPTIGAAWNSKFAKTCLAHGLKNRRKRVDFLE
ncbi:hypothetical protein RPHASCH2410_PD04335 (plasmid) [Rhizobium phaseoli Ch24-10]|nr:hypothetical protein RPHASCH2410_PD04335 [Rhizobium phaseoli Ch24-10]